MSNDNSSTNPKDSPCGCAGDITLPDINPECVAPSPMPWVDCNNCLKWFVATTVLRSGTVSVPANSNFAADAGTITTPLTVAFEVTYQFSLCLKGRQPGKLLYTTSLIPQEEMKIYISDRFRKISSATACVSSQSSLRQSVSALQQSQVSGSLSEYTNQLNQSNESGGGSVSFLGLFSIGGGGGADSSSQTIQSLASSMQSFQQTIVAASASVEAQRSLVVSNYEDQQNVSTTSRTLKNFNNTRAITYYVRQINEVYDLSASVFKIRWMITESRGQGLPSGWQDAADAPVGDPGANRSGQALRAGSARGA